MKLAQWVVTSVTSADTEVECRQRRMRAAMRFMALLAQGHLHLHAGCVALALELSLPLGMRTLSAATASLQRTLRRGAACSDHGGKGDGGGSGRGLARLCKDALEVLRTDLATGG